MKRFPRWLMVFFAFVLVVLVSGGGLFYKAQEHRLRAEAEQNLQAISRLKMDQIALWRMERLADADEMIESPFTRKVVAGWIAAPDSRAEGQILSWFRSLQKHYHFSDVLLVDAEGQRLLSLSGRKGRLHPETLRALGESFREGRPLICDLHLAHDRSPIIEVVAPLFSKENNGDKPFGALIQRIDARQFLYPLIASWPTESRSAETMIVRRDGASVLYLNDPRYRKNSALQLTIPLTRRDDPAVKAVLGDKGMMEGRDYRGVEVLAVAHAVPDSNWFMVAKVDKAEVLADWHFLSSVILALLLGLVGAIVATMGMAWQHYTKTHYRQLYKAETALGKSEERYATTVMSIGDGVIATDAQGRVELLNPIAEALTGWTQQEGRGKALSEVFRIISQETRQPAENPLERVLREGFAVELPAGTVLVTRDGKEHPIADSGAPIRDRDGAITGGVIVFRDQSKELALWNELRESEDKFRNLYDEAPIGYIEMDAEGRIDRVNRRLLELMGYEPEEMLGRPMWDFVVEREASEEFIRAKLSGLKPPSPALERSFKRKNGPPIPVLVKDRLARDRAGRINRLRATIQDITDLKLAQEALRRSRDELEIRVQERTAELERRNQDLQDFVFIASHDLQEPLRKIQVLGDLLEQRSGTALNECCRGYLDRIVKAAGRMRALLESLLLYSRVSREDRPPEEANLTHLVQEALSQLEVLIVDKNARVQVDPLPTIPVNAIQMVEVFQNLVANALKFSREGAPPHIRIYARACPGQDGVACQIFVEDNGIGFEEKYLDKIFVPFQRLHDGAQYKGVGMGLAICKKILERHGGTITATSTPGKGSTFMVTLPLSKSDVPLLPVSPAFSPRNGHPSPPLEARASAELSFSSASVFPSRSSICSETPMSSLERLTPPRRTDP